MLIGRRLNDYQTTQGSRFARWDANTPVTKKHLDSLDVGATVCVSYEVVEGQNIVTSIA